MSFELKLAFKYFRSRRRSLVRFTSIVAVIGIAVGVASLIIAQALSNGFSQAMQDKVLRNTAHITIYIEDGTEFSNWEILRGQVERVENVESFQPTSYESAVITSDERSGYAVLRVKEEVPAKGQRSKERKEEQRAESKLQISVGKELAEKLEVKVGDKAEIFTLENENLPQKTDVQVKDIFETGLYEYDSTWIYIDEANYLELKELDKFSPKIFSVTVRDIYRANETAGLIRENLGDNFKILDWQEANKPLFAALSLERKVAVAIILLIIFIAALNITTTLSLLVAERKPDMAVLRTCGAKTKNLVAIFLLEGIMLSLAGIFSGVIIGLAVCFFGNYFRLISLSKQVYSLNYIPFEIDFGTVLIISLLTFLLSLVAIFYPALKASRIKPLENLRI